MKPTRTVLCLAVLALTGCAVTPPAPTALPATVAVLPPTAAASATATLPTSTPAVAATATAPRPTRTPTPQLPTPEPTPTPLWQTSLYIQPEQLWSIQVPTALGRVEQRNEQLTMLSGAERGTVLVVDTYLATRDEYASAGEGLRSRACEVVSQLYGADLPCDAVELEDYRWEVAVAFHRSGGVKGQALYAQPLRNEGDYRVYGVILAYPDTSEATARPLLEAVRDTFKPLSALELQVSPGGEPLWAVFSHGLRGFDPSVAGHHFLAVFAHGAAGWQERARLALPAPDWLYPGSVTQVQVEPAHLWLTVEGGVGAHGGTFQLLSYAPGALKLEAEGSSMVPDAGAMQDLDGDGILDAVLNQTFPYVFCYACGVRYPDYQVLRWDGAGFVEVQLTWLDGTVPAGLREPVNRAVALAQGGLWKDAQAASALVPGSEDPVAVWDLALIRLHAEALAELAGDPGAAYPLLQQLFYGDYGAVLGVMRPYTPAEIFSAAGPLIAGTVAEGWEAELSATVVQFTTQALGAEPELAAACFLRGWAAYLADAGDPQAQADVRRAAELAPEESLYAEALAYLEE